MPDKNEDDIKQDNDELYAEWRCKRCGICCGSTDGHPCEHLRRDGDNKYFCEIYEKRFGIHRTVDGMPFRCVRIQTIIETLGGYSECAYVKELLRRRSAGEK